jgi:D-glycero-D-manno-heptose 1,7-bisphosphate phosphatase
LALVILDRDGVINHDSAEFIRSPEEWIPIPGSLEAIARLNHAGFRVVVATNQAALGHQLLDIETLNHIHEKMQRQLIELGGSIEAIFFCPHRAKDGCECRKPLPGMLLKIAHRLRIPLTNVPAIGDSERDIVAALRVGAQPILVKTGNGKTSLDRVAKLGRIPVFEDLAAAADALIAGDLTQNE